MRAHTVSRDPNWWSGVGNGPLAPSPLPAARFSRTDDLTDWFRAGNAIPGQQSLGSPFNFMPSPIQQGQVSPEMAKRMNAYLARGAYAPVVR